MVHSCAARSSWRLSFPAGAYLFQLASIPPNSFDAKQLEAWGAPVRNLNLEKPTFSIPAPALSIYVLYAHKETATPRTV